MGTPGYIDPLYVETGEYHRHSDVYATGLVVLQALTGRPSVRWSAEGRTLHLTELCFEHRAQPMEVADSSAGWDSDVAGVLIELGLDCTETGRGAAARRPSVPTMIARIGSLIQLKPISPPPDAQRECLVCLEETRGQHRFMPCGHAVCCGECSRQLHDRGAQCVVCRQPIGEVQEGDFPVTWQGGEQHR